MAMGRPPKEISQEEFEKLCHIQCTKAEIANWFECCETSIENWCVKTYGTTFQEAFEKFSVGGKISLRRLQFKHAEKSYAMAIWLGKQYLGQRDIVDVTAPGAESTIEKIAKTLANVG